jgi:pyridoxal phosphate enzyme (YggS family)
VAVSKFHPVDALREAYDAGQRIFAESREQELRMKYDALPHDIQWHFIGHLQTNKVKQIAPIVSCVQSVDSLRLLDELERQVARVGAQRKAAGLSENVDVLLQVHIAQEETKSGFTPKEINEIAVGPDDLQCLAVLAGRWPHLNLVGLMGMASNTDDADQIRREFHALVAMRDYLRQQTGLPLPTLSMGMSEDYPIALECGSTMVRVGTDIFGPREY